MREEEYVIQRALENDFYKLTMGQFIFHQWGEKWPIVRFSLKVRTPDIPLSIISESRLREEFEHAFTMVPNRTEMHYLRGTNEYERRMFEEDYLDFLGRLNTIPIKITINKVGESYDISFEGPWAAVTNCEVRGLAIVKRLYVKYLLEQLTPFERKVYFATARVKLYEKIKRLRTRPWIKVACFAFRRASVREWHDELVEIMLEELASQFIGTSNTHLASEKGIMPIGTYGHELHMVAAGIADSLDLGDEGIRESQNDIYQRWYEEYGHGLSICLPDTYTSQFTRKTAPASLATNWKGHREDSGDPIAEGLEWQRWYEHHGVDSRVKMDIPSDGLEIDTMFAIDDILRGKFRLSFGWGTNLGDDMGWEIINRPLLKSFSVVVKPTAIVLEDGREMGLVKISNNPAKATGRATDIQRYMKIFECERGNYQTCKY